jgi:RimJ/RimL family protein N-acetyltransferase
MNLTPVTLQGRHVRLEPLALDHLDALCEVGLDEELWALIPVRAQTREGMQTYIEVALRLQESKSALPFVTIEQSTGRVVGSTRFMSIDAPNRHVEIGSTWIAKPWQRTAINTEAKFLMLRYAFETLGCLRVELKTDSLNEKSQKAILRIGAKQEGTFRNHMICWNGRIRHTVWFSVIDSEWLEVKKQLEEKLCAGS